MHLLPSHWRCQKRYNPNSVKCELSTRCWSAVDVGCVRRIRKSIFSSAIWNTSTSSQEFIRNQDACVSPIGYIASAWYTRCTENFKLHLTESKQFVLKFFVRHNRLTPFSGGIDLTRTSCNFCLTVSRIIFDNFVYIFAHIHIHIHTAATNMYLYHRYKTAFSIFIQHALPIWNHPLFHSMQCYYPCLEYLKSTSETETREAHKAHGIQ